MRFSAFAALFVVFAHPLAIVRADDVQERLRDRTEFTRLLRTISVGQDAASIRELLGTPDDVRTPADPGGIGTNRTREIWYYGTNGHLTFPTLGSVHVDDDGKAQYVYGNRGDPPPPNMFSEPELRDLLRLIDRAPAFHKYDPLEVIRIVNRLLPLGKDKALAAISEYLRVASQFDSDARNGLFWVLRVLFELPPTGFMPPMLVGAPDPPEPKDRALVPRFPIVLIDDIPLTLVRGYMLAGHAQSVEDHVDYFRKHGQLRSAPLRPTDDPLSVLDKLVASPQWLHGREYEPNYGERRKPDAVWADHGRRLVMEQLLSLVDTVYRPTTECPLPCAVSLDESWAVIHAAIEKLEIHWDEQRVCYVFKDGTCLPKRKRVIYQRSLLDLAECGPFTGKLYLERLSETTVELGTELTAPGVRSSERAVLRVVDDATTELLAKLDIQPLEAGSRFSTVSFRSPVGHALRIEIVLGDMTQHRVYHP